MVSLYAFYYAAGKPRSFLPFELRSAFYQAFGRALDSQFATVVFPTPNEPLIITIIESSRNGETRPTLLF